MLYVAAYDVSVENDKTGPLKLSLSQEEESDTVVFLHRLNMCCAEGRLRQAANIKGMVILLIVDQIYQKKKKQYL